jgi:alpha-amylase
MQRAPVALKEAVLGVLLQGFFFGPGRIAGVPSPLDGDHTVPFWWDHLAAQADMFAKAGFSAIWLPPPLKGASGSFSSGYDLFDDYDLGDKNQKGTTPTRYGTREQLERCAAMFRANGIDLYIDLVENQRDGDDGHFNFLYADALGQAGKGRFAKGPGDFHPHVPQDPGVFSDIFQFGRDLAPINGIPKNHCGDGLVNAADWLTRALDLQGYRLDNTKGVSTVFARRLLNSGTMAGKFAVGEFADGNISLIESWANAVGHRSAAFDFPLHFMLKDMCNNGGGFNMASLDHAGLVGVDPQGAVTFVENHDTDRGGVGGPVVRNKMLAYAYILTSEGYPCVFYRDYSTDKNCFGLKPKIDVLIKVHERLATGPTLQRWKDGGVFAYERLGGSHLLVGLNKDEGFTRTIRVQTGFPPNTELEDFAGHAPRVRTDGGAAVTITIPKNGNGLGYVCYAPPAALAPFVPAAKVTTQDYEGAADLDIKPAGENQRIEVCRIFVAANAFIATEFFFDTAHWTAATSIRLDLDDPAGAAVDGGTFHQNSAQGSGFRFQARTQGFYSLFVTAANTPAQNKTPHYRLRLAYTAPQTP